MRLPFVSRRAYELLHEQFDRVLRERAEQQERADRAMDQLASRFGFEPVSAPVRQEAAAAKSEMDKYVEQLNEDPGAGMIDESFIDEVADSLSLGSAPAPHGTN